MSPCFLEKANVPEYEYLRALVTSMLIDLRLEDPLGISIPYLKKTMMVIII